MTDNLKPGPLGTHSQGKIRDDDQGDLQVSVEYDEETKAIIINFGESVTWLGLDRKAAIEMGNALLRLAKRIR